MTALLLTGGWVFDGRELVGVQDVVIVDGLVASAADDVEVIDCRGHTVMPGIIDAHVHLAWAGPSELPASPAESAARAATNSAALLRAGVTTVRDTGGPLEVLSQLEQSGAGPDLLHCGRMLCAPGGHGTEIPIPVPIAQECSGPAAFAAAAREQVAGGAAMVKVALNGADGSVQLSAAELTAVVEAAHELGARVACHASVRDALHLAVACGVDTIEHGNGLDPSLAAAMRELGISLVPTVSIFEELQANLGVLPSAHRCAVDRRVREHGPAIQAAHGAGVTIALGTDRVPGGDVVAVEEEMRAMLRHGLTLVEVLRAATTGSARALGLDDRGSLDVGMRADVVVFPGDLSQELGSLEPRTVIKAGTQVR